MSHCYNFEDATRVWSIMPDDLKACQNCHTKINEQKAGWIMDPIGDRSIGVLVCSPKCRDAYTNNIKISMNQQQRAAPRIAARLDSGLPPLVSIASCTDATLPPLVPIASRTDATLPPLVPIGSRIDATRQMPALVPISKTGYSQSHLPPLVPIPGLNAQKQKQQQLPPLVRINADMDGAPNRIGSHEDEIKTGFGTMVHGFALAASTAASNIRDGTARVVCAFSAAGKAAGSEFGNAMEIQRRSVWDLVDSNKLFLALDKVADSNLTKNLGRHAYQSWVVVLPYELSDSEFTPEEAEKVAKYIVHEHHSFINGCDPFIKDAPSTHVSMADTKIVVEPKDQEKSEYWVTYSLPATEGEAATPITRLAILHEARNGIVLKTTGTTK